MTLNMKFVIILVFLQLELISLSSGKQKIVNIGAIFDPDSEKQLEAAFKCAVDNINGDAAFLPHIKFQTQLISVPTTDSFKTGKMVCEIASHGVAVIFGPHSSSSARTVRSYCEKLEILNLQYSWYWDSKLRPRTYMNIHPHPYLLAKAYADVIQLLDWQKFTVIYETEECLLRLHEVLKRRQYLQSTISIHQLPEASDYRPLLKEIRESKETRIVLHCSTYRILKLLRQAKEIGMMDDYESYFIISLDTHTVDLSDFSDTQTNITSIRLVNSSTEVVKEAFTVHDYKGCLTENYKSLSNMTTDAALIYDAVHLFAKAYKQLDQTTHVNIRPIYCNGKSTSTFGFALRKIMSMIKFDGLSGTIKFDKEGRRTDFNLEVVRLGSDSVRKIATWNSVNGMTRESSEEEDFQEVEKHARNKIFIVASKTGMPYLQYVPGADKKVGNEMFEGFTKDLMDEITTEANLKGYELKIVRGNKQGSIDPETGKWDGIMREVIDRKADLGVCDMSVTYERGLAVDFTVPFMTTGISILYIKTKKKTPELFSFLEPFNFDVWIYMATAYLGVSLMLFLHSRISPYEWRNPHPCNSSTDILENNLSLNNCLWHNIGSLMQQGSDIAPQAVSTRIVASLWWFFTLIMISSYTANLAAFLTITRMESPIKGAEDLAKQSKVKYGPMKDGATARFFEKTDNPTYSRMWKAMQRYGPEVFAESNEEGVSKVQRSKGGYAFFMESLSIEYETERKCELTGIGGLLDSKGYGIALPRNSPYRSLINAAILTLSEKGKLDELKKRWWIERGGGKCNLTDKELKNDSELSMQNVGGVFLVLVSGCFSSFLVCILEFLWNCRKIAVVQKITPAEAIIQELKFAVSLHKRTKPIIRQEPDYITGSMLFEKSP